MPPTKIFHGMFDLINEAREREVPSFHSIMTLKPFLDVKLKKLAYYLHPSILKVKNLSRSLAGIGLAFES